MVRQRARRSGAHRVFLPTRCTSRALDEFAPESRSHCCREVDQSLQRLALAHQRCRGLPGVRVGPAKAERRFRSGRDDYRFVARRVECGCPPGINRADTSVCHACRHRRAGLVWRPFRITVARRAACVQCVSFRAHCHRRCVQRCTLLVAPPLGSGVAGLHRRRRRIADLPWRSSLFRCDCGRRSWQCGCAVGARPTHAPVVSPLETYPVIAGLAFPRCAPCSPHRGSRASPFAALPPNQR